jgi:polyhydroxyalkanoate synthesis repressor PhaR
MVVVKRYSNRKLYDTENRRYITLEEIGDRVRNGEDIRVFDHETNDDLTTITLFQVILDQEKRIGGILPQVMLTRMLRSGGETLSGLRSSIKAFLDPIRYAEDEIRRRLNVLEQKGMLSQEEGQRLETLLEDPQLRRVVYEPVEIEEEPPGMEEVRLLLEEAQRLERQLEELQT